jgi:vancomycin resistance protein YoaR
MSDNASTSPDAAHWARHPAVLTLGAVLLLVVVAVAVLWTVQRDRVLPNTSVAGVDVGGLTADEVGGAIDDVARARERDTVTFTFEDERYELVPEDLDYRIDDAATIDAALSRGRSNLLSDLGVRVASLWRERDLALVEVADRQELVDAVDGIADEVDRDRFAGAVSADPETLEVSLEPPLGSVEVRRDEAVAQLEEAILSPGPEELELPVDTTEPPVDPADVEAVAGQLEAAIAEPLVVAGEDETLTVDPAQLVALIDVVESDEGDGLELAVEEETVEEMLGDAASERFDQSPVSARFTPPRSPPTSFSDMGSTSWSPTSVEVGAEEGRDGREFDPADAADALTAAVREADREATIQLLVTEPPLPNSAIDELRPSHLLGTFTTSYSAGEVRNANIQRLADVIDGTQVLPGEQFSINEISGERSCDKGYDPAGTIVQGELVDTCGGGVSQFGTTTFNAAFFAGVQLDQWQAHSFYISRYPEGREATLSFPQLDVRFTNDTDGAIVVRASYTSTSVTVSVYGQPLASSVSASHGSRSDPREPTTEERTTSELASGETRTVQSTGSPGFTVEVVRTVDYLEGGSDSQTITTTYRPQNGIVERGTG